MLVWDDRPHDRKNGEYINQQDFNTESYSFILDVILVEDKGVILNFLNFRSLSKKNGATQSLLTIAGPLPARN